MPIVFTPMAMLMALGSGLASAVLFASVIGGTMLAVPLFALTALPIVIVALGWGTFPGLVATAIGAVGIFVAFTGPAAGVFLLQAAGPALLLSHLIGLARHDVTGVEWYPVGRVVAGAALAMAAVAVIGGIAFGYDPDEWAARVTDSLVLIYQDQGAGQSADALRAQVTPVAQFMVRLLPVMLPMLWTFILIFNLWLGAKVVARSDRLVRPWEDLAAFELPRGVGLAMAATLLATLAPDPIGAAASPFLGAFLAVYTLLGLAVIHVVTRGSGARPIILATIYGIVFLFSFPALVLVAIGLVEPYWRIRDRRRGGPPAVS